MKRIFLVFSVIIAAFSVFIFFSCSPGTPGSPVTVATMVDSEGSILGKAMILLMESKGIPVTDKVGFGTPDILRKALVAGEVDLAVDYTGSGQYYHDDLDNTVFNDPVKGYELIRDVDRKRHDLVWLTPAKANNTESLAVLRSFAEANGLKTMVDLAAYINSGKPVKLICAVGFAETPLGLPGFEKAYGFTLGKDQLILLESGNTAQMLKALVDGTDGVNVSLVYGTDGALDKLKVQVLEDPANVPPVYLPTPIVRGAVLEKYPALEDLFTPFFETLDLVTLQSLNARVAFDGEDPREVARTYLKDRGLIEN